MLERSNRFIYKSMLPKGCYDAASLNRLASNSHPIGEKQNIYKKRRPFKSYSPIDWRTNYHYPAISEQ